MITAEMIREYNEQTGRSDLPIYNSGLAKHLNDKQGESKPKTKDAIVSELFQRFYNSITDIGERVSSLEQKASPAFNEKCCARLEERVERLEDSNKDLDLDEIMDCTCFKERELQEKYVYQNNKRVEYKKALEDIVALTKRTPTLSKWDRLFEIIDKALRDTE